VGRPPLDIGTWGEIRTSYWHHGRWVPAAKHPVPRGVRPEKWKALAQFRDLDGHTRQVERQGPSEDSAKRHLRAALKERAGKNPVTLTAASRFRDAAPLFLDRIRMTKAGTTYDRYRGNLTNHALPALGGLRLTECTSGRIQDYLDSLGELDPVTGRPRYSPNTRRDIRKVISGTLQVAVRKGLLPTNPATSLDKIEGGAVRPARAMEVADVLVFLAKLDADKQSRRADLPDLIRFLFGTGTRFGEALAVRWRDVNLTDHPVKVDGEKIPPHTVWINGNLVHVTGKGVVRHGGKTFAANRMIGLAGFLHALLVARRPDDADELEPVFPSGQLGWRAPANVQRSVRRMRERLGYGGFHTHDARATVLTLLDEAKQTTRQIADLAGHAQLRTTQGYMGRGMANPEAAAIIDAAHRPRAITTE
jgi:integrase